MLRGGRVRSGNGTLESPIALVPCPVVATMSSVLPVTRRFPTGEGVSQGRGQPGLRRKQKGMRPLCWVGSG